MSKMKNEKSVKDRVRNICDAEIAAGDYTDANDDFTPYRLAQLLRITRQTLGQDKPATSLLDWALRRCEEEGVGYYKRMEDKLGKFRLKS